MEDITPKVKPIFRLKTGGKTDWFKSWQWQVIICSMIGYAMFYFVRKNFSFAIPMLQDAFPGLTKAPIEWDVFQMLILVASS